MTDGLRIAHPQDCPLEGNLEVGNPEGNRSTGLYMYYILCTTYYVAL